MPPAEAQTDPVIANMDAAIAALAHYAGQLALQAESIQSLTENPALASYHPDLHSVYAALDAAAFQTWAQAGRLTTIRMNAAGVKYPTLNPAYRQE